MIAALLVVAIGLLAGGILFKVLEDVSRRPEGLDTTWDRAVAEEHSQLNQIFMRAARPLSKVPNIYESGVSKRYQALQAQLMAGNVFGRSVEVYLAVQALSVYVALLLMLAVLVGAHSTSLDFVGLLFGGVIIALPWNRKSSAVKKRAEEVSRALPEFAELLVMPLESGMTPLTALSFTADQHPGPVSDEVKYLRAAIDSHAIPEAEAFQLVGTRLGSPEAQAFIMAIMHAHLEGGRLIDTISSQAKALREAQYQRERQEIRRLPLKLIPILAVFLMPMLFILAFLPAAYSLTKL